MDSLTHIGLGAAIGEALAGKRLGKKAMLIGAIANSLPDIDFIASFWLDTSRDVLAHRGITHSFFFIVVVAPLLARGASRIFRRRGMATGERTGVGKGMNISEKMDAGKGMNFGRWCVFFGVQLFVHDFIDAFNAYGTGWLEPFNHHRFAFHILFVADPFYSFWLGVSFVALLVLRPGSRHRRFWWRFGLILSSCYLCYCFINKYRIDQMTESELARQGVAYTRYFTTPTPLNNWLWYIVAEDPAGFYTGYLSLFDRTKTIAFRYFPRNDSLLAPFRDRGDVRCLLRFSQGYHSTERWKDTVVFNDLRFGEMRGWEDPQARFVFHYYLQYPDDNLLILQRGRFTGWDGRTFRAFIRRIEGE